MYGFSQCPPCCPYCQMIQQQGMYWGQQQPCMSMPMMPPQTTQPMPVMPSQMQQPMFSMPFIPPHMMQGMPMSPQMPQRPQGIFPMSPFMKERDARVTPPLCNGFYYTVTPGDTMYLISRRFNVSLDDLVNANPWVSDPAQIFPGLRICIPRENNDTPVPPEQPIACPDGYIYTVVRGDTLSAIANRFDLTNQDLLRANPQLIDPNRLYIGQQLCIPLPIPEPPSTCDGTTHIILKGQTLTSIAQANNLTVDELLGANPQITDPNLIFAGQVICIPNR